MAEGCIPSTFSSPPSSRGNGFYVSANKQLAGRASARLRSSSNRFAWATTHYLQKERIRR